jgi:hypothetical protein
MLASVGRAIWGVAGLVTMFAPHRMGRLVCPSITPYKDESPLVVNPPLQQALRQQPPFI